VTLVVVSASAGAAVAAVLRAAEAADRVQAASERRIRQDVAFYGAMAASRPRVGRYSPPESDDLDMIDDPGPDEENANISPVFQSQADALAAAARGLIRAYSDAFRDLAAVLDRGL
jgi:hypothetical protein